MSARRVLRNGADSAVGGRLLVAAQAPTPETQTSRPRRTGSGS
jgi:hypothetical protein